MVLETIEHGDLPVLHAFPVQCPDLLCQILCLQKGIIVIPYKDQASPFFLTCHRIPILKKLSCRLQNIPAGTVVHRKGQFLCFKLMLQIIKHRLHTAPPAVDQLIGVAYGKQPGILSLEGRDEFNLLFITVLHLIHDDPGRLRMRPFPV